MNIRYNIIKVALAIVIIALAYFLYESIMKPVRFNTSVKEREAVVIARLNDIRTSQQFYRRQYSKYTNNFDSLINFLKTGIIPEVRMVPDPNDTTFSKTIYDTLGFVKVADSLFKSKSHFSLDSIKYIPFAEGQKFEIAAGEVDRGGIKVGVYEVKAPFTTFLRGLDKQLVINLIKSKEDIEKYPGLKLGSMEEPSTDGNWE